MGVYLHLHPLGLPEEFSNKVKKFFLKIDGSTCLVSCVNMNNINTIIIFLTTLQKSDKKNRLVYHLPLVLVRFMKTKVMVQSNIFIFRRKTVKTRNC